MELSERQADVLQFIIQYKRAHDGCSPSVREIMEGCYFSSTSAVFYQLERLENSGRIMRLAEPRLSRGIMVMGGEWKFKAGSPDGGLRK